MSENLVREIHDAAAFSPDPVQASVRPPGTTARQLGAMVGDVLRKLDVGPSTTVVEIGCGTGVIGAAIARRARRYVGVDFAPQAVQVFQARLQEEGLTDRARVLCLDVLAEDDAQLRELGQFDRVLMYAVLHYARSSAEAQRFLERAVALRAPRGRIVIGNVPLTDQERDAAPRAASTLAARVVATLRWLSVPGGSPARLTRRWKLRRAVALALASRARAKSSFAPSGLPPEYTVALEADDVERRLAQVDGTLECRWSAPDPGVPLASGRADLVIDGAR